jgi:hypothetical protein
VALSQCIAESLAARLRSQLFLRLLGREALFFDRVRTGQMTSWLGQDVELLQVGGPAGAFFLSFSSLLPLPPPSVAGLKGLPCGLERVNL